MSDNKEHPLIVVCYIDRATINDGQLMKVIADGINETIKQKEANMITFFVPTDGPEKVECINPVLTTEPQKEKINKIINDVSESFGIGNDNTEVNE